MKDRSAAGTFLPRSAECHPDKKHKGNGLCVTCYSRERARRNAETNRERSKAWYWNNREYAIERAVEWTRQHRARFAQRRLAYRYGITPERFEELLTAQDHRCPVCGKGFDPLQFSNRPAVDHDHESGQVRGILHVRCNSAIGILDDSAEVLRRAAEYLERNR